MALDGRTTKLLAELAGAFRPIAGGGEAATPMPEFSQTALNVPMSDRHWALSSS